MEERSSLPTPAPGAGMYRAILVLVCRVCGMPQTLVEGDFKKLEHPTYPAHIPPRHQIETMCPACKTVWVVELTVTER
jgi:hypothetical protein